MTDKQDEVENSELEVCQNSRLLTDKVKASKFILLLSVLINVLTGLFRFRNRIWIVYD